VVFTKEVDGTVLPPILIIVALGVTEVVISGVVVEVGDSVDSVDSVVGVGDVDVVIVVVVMVFTVDDEFDNGAVEIDWLRHVGWVYDTIYGLRQAAHRSV
jgi:hypothetical protein